MSALDLFDWVYLVTNVFGTYIIFKMMRIFFGEKRTSRIIEFMSYVGYFVLCSASYL